MQIAIIGAGLSGLSCATQLKTRGHQVTVFEKSRGPSGRASTRKADDWQADHGAQYFTARSPEFQTVTAQWIDQGIVSPWAGRIMSLEKGSLRKSESVVRMVGQPGMTAMARSLAQDIDLRLMHTITELKACDSSWQIESKEHGLHPDRFDRVVFAIPAPQLQPFQLLFSEAICQAIHRVVFDPCLALMLQYDSPLDLGFDGLFANDAEVSWVSRNNSKPGRSGKESWVVHLTPAASQAHWESPVEIVGAVADQFLQRHGAPCASAVTLHRWRYALAHSGPEIHSMLDAATGLAICGDWLSGGRIEGAWVSGQHAAAQICAAFE
jgi:renalase